MDAAFPRQAFRRLWAPCWSPVVDLLPVLALAWTNGSEVRTESVRGQDLGVLVTPSVHARLRPVAARCGTAKNRQHQTVCGSPTWAYWSYRRDARSRPPHPYSVCGGAGCLLTRRCSLAL